MRTYTVQEIMGVRDLYMEPPYPGFSLDEVLRKRALRGTTLPRGDNAWKVASAKSADEGIARIVQGALNKLAPEKYQEVVEQLTVPTLIASERAMQIVIDLIFKKALQEPGYSELYARLCYDMASYEVRLQQNTPTATNSASSPASLSTPSEAHTPSSTTATKRVSKFRDNIIRVAQKEFQLTDPHQFETLSGEELEEARSALVKRKKANITFVGQLHVHRVLSAGIMLSIVQQVLKTGETKAEPPQEVDIEVLYALLETIGKQLDRDSNREKLDQHFEKLKQLQNLATYPMRVKFKIMNLIELRNNRWEPRITRVDKVDPTTLQEQARKDGGSSSSSGAATHKQLGPRSPTVATPNSRNKGGMARFPSASQFPDSPQPAPAPSMATWRNVAAPQRETPVAYTPADFTNRNNGSGSSSRDLPFDKIVKAVMTEWVNERSNEPIANWRARFKTVTEFETDEELCQAIVVEVIREACIVTKKDAQHEACSFLRVALALEPDDTPITLGLVDVLAEAIEEGIKEDVPKFYERFVTILHMITEKETIVELYCDAAKLLYVTYERVQSLDGVDVIPELLEVWGLLPMPENDDELLPDNVVNFVVDLREANQDELAGELVVSLLATELISKSSIDAWLGSTSAAQAPAVVSLVQGKINSMLAAAEAAAAEAAAAAPEAGSEEAK